MTQTASARYRTGARAVLYAAQDVQAAWGSGDEDRAYAAVNSLLDAALARESGGVIAGFGPESAEPTSEPLAAGTADQLARALTEIEIGDVLLTASVPPAAASADPTAQRTMNAAIGSLDEITTAASSGIPASSAFLGGRQFEREDFLAELPKTVNVVVEGTAQVGKSAVGGLATIPAAELSPVFTGVLSNVPNLRAIAQAGMRAIKRAVEAIIDLVPAEIRDKISAWAKEWWDKSGVATVTATVVSHLLAVDRLQAELDTVTTSVRSRPDSYPEGPMQQGLTTLHDLNDRFARTNKIIAAIVAALRRLIGPLAALIPAGAGWIYLTGGVGLVAATGAAVWVGRDYLDAGAPLERVAGVRAILREATGARAAQDEATQDEATQDEATPGRATED